MTRTLFYSLLASALLAASAWALDLASARTRGLIGEGNTGYTVALSPEASALSEEINAKRRAEYARISKANGQPVEVVAKLAVPQIVSNLPAGAKYQNASGRWTAK